MNVAEDLTLSVEQSMRAQWLQQSQEAKQGTALCVGYCNSAGCSLKLVELPNVDQRLGFFFPMDFL